MDNLDLPEEVYLNAGVSAVAPTWIDIKMKEFDRSRYTNLPLIEPVEINYYLNDIKKNLNKK